MASLYHPCDGLSSVSPVSGPVSVWIGFNSLGPYLRDKAGMANGLIYIHHQVFTARLQTTNLDNSCTI